MHDEIDIRPFEEPVHLETDAGKRDVCSTREAAEMLLCDWPIGETGMRMKARMACMRALAGNEPPAVAREAFVQAAKEARILVESYEDAH